MKFKKQVKDFCIPKDYKNNKRRLNHIKEYNHELFINVLKCGAEIVPAIKIIDLIERITIETSLTQSEVLDIMTKSLIFNLCLNIRQYN